MISSFYNKEKLENYFFTTKKKKKSKREQREGYHNDQELHERVKIRLRK